MAIASHCSTPDAQGQSIWSTLFVLNNFVRERREARGLSGMRLWRSEFATDSSHASSNRNFPGRVAEFAGPTVVPYPTTNPYPTGGSGNEAGASSMIGSPAINFSSDSRNQEHGMDYMMDQSGGSDVGIPHHEIPQSGAPVNAGHYTYPSQFLPGNQMNFGGYGSSGDQHPVLPADRCSECQLPPPAVPSMSGQSFRPWNEEYHPGMEENN